jgi:hypothetical protein
MQMSPRSEQHPILPLSASWLCTPDQVCWTCILPLLVDLSLVPTLTAGGAQQWVDGTNHRGHRHRGDQQEFHIMILHCRGGLHSVIKLALRKGSG